MAAFCLHSRPGLQGAGATQRPLLRRARRCPAARPTSASPWAPRSKATGGPSSIPPRSTDLIKQALDNNQDIAAAKARVAQAQEEVNAAQAALLPSLTFGTTVGRQKYGKSLFGPLDFQIPPFTYYTVGPSISAPLDLFGGQQASARGAPGAYDGLSARTQLARRLSLPDRQRRDGGADGRSGPRRNSTWSRTSLPTTSAMSTWSRPRSMTASRPAPSC